MTPDPLSLNLPPVAPLVLDPHAPLNRPPFSFAITSPLEYRLLSSHTIIDSDGGSKPPPVWLTSTHENQSTAPSFSNPSSYTAYTHKKSTATPSSSSLACACLVVFLASATCPFSNRTFTLSSTTKAPCDPLIVFFNVVREPQLVSSHPVQA